LRHHLLATACAVVAGMAFFVGGQALAAPTESFTPAQRAEIVGIMREALQNDPTILTDAIRSIREKAEEQKQDSTLAAVRAHQSELQTAPAFAIRGNPHGKITVVEFYDPRCSYCRSMMGEVDSFLNRHPDVRLVEKVVPVLGNNSVLDTRAIFAASMQGKYEAMRKALMEDTTKPSMERIAELAQANGIDAKKLAADMNSPQTITLINTNLDQGRSVGLDGTPTFIFGTAAVAPGALEPDQMDAFLDRARKA